jgi:hypothetical protein
MTAKIAVIIIPLLVLLLVMAYAIPATTGYQVHCRGVEQSICEQAWADLKDHFLSHEDRRPVPDWIPITGVSVEGATNDAPRCGTWTIHRYGIWDDVWIRDCA